MDQVEMTKRLVSLQKTTFDNMLSNMLLYWDQTERLSDTFLGQAAWIPEEGKRALMTMVRNNKRAVEQFKQAVDEGYNRMDRCFVRTEGYEQAA